MNTLYVMQGVPGSGKTTVAVAMHKGMANCIICSTDDYHVENGKYEFKAHKLSEFHALNNARVKEWLSNGQTVILDNTNIQKWQCREVVAFAVDNGIPVVFIRVTGKFTSLHGVPAEKINQMYKQMEDLTVENVIASKSKIN